MAIDGRGSPSMYLSAPRTGVVHLVAVAAIAIVGCAPKNTDMLHFLPEREHQVSAIEYRLGIPDGIQITAPRILEIDGETQHIHPDGKITLKLLGDVKVIGMTAKELAAKLEVLLGRYYVDPKVSVKVVDYNSKKFYVYGEGMPPGPRPYTGRDTLIDAVMPSVGNFLAETSKVKVIRPSHGDAPPREIIVNIDHMMKIGDWSQNILLEPNDVVYVPPTPWALFAHGVRGLLYPVSPAVQAYATPAYVRDIDDVYDDDSNSTYIYAPAPTY